MPWFFLLGNTYRGLFTFIHDPTANNHCKSFHERNGKAKNGIIMSTMGYLGNQTSTKLVAN